VIFREFEIARTGDRKIPLGIFRVYPHRGKNKDEQ